MPVIYALEVRRSLRPVSPWALICLVACGGRSSGAPSGITVVDSGTGVSADAETSDARLLDEAQEAGKDVAGTDGGEAGPSCGPPPPGCARLQNALACPAGFVCDPSQGCTASGCWCEGSGWDCTADCGGGLCVSGDATTPGAVCPPTPPPVGAPCIGPIGCPYSGPCNTLLVACSATQSSWQVTGFEQCINGCPPFDPAMGTACSAKQPCRYTTACGATDTVTCNGVEVVSVQRGSCGACGDCEE
jgi:hypothetical protein